MVYKGRIDGPFLLQCRRVYDASSLTQPEEETPTTVTYKKKYRHTESPPQTQSESSALVPTVPRTLSSDRPQL